MCGRGLGSVVKKVGILGISEGNGHPFSFSAIINGYDETGLSQSGWPGIYDYVRRRDPSEFGIQDLEVTHAWTQDAEVTRTLCRSCRILHAVSRPEEMLDAVDAVIIARDDYDVHVELARPFLEAGLPVFVDKPLSLDVEGLRFFRPYLESGKLMSCSGMRYARELDEERASIEEYGQLRLIRGAIVLSWEKYGIHLVDAVFGVTSARPLSVVAPDASHSSMVVDMDDGSLLQIDALGEVPRTFRVDIWGEKRASTSEITDNFSMFRRMLWHFAEMIRVGCSPIPVVDTLGAMRLLIAGRIAKQTGKKVLLSDIQV